MKCYWYYCGLSWKADWLMFSCPKQTLREQCEELRDRKSVRGFMSQASSVEIGHCQRRVTRRGHRQMPRYGAESCR